MNSGLTDNNRTRLIVFMISLSTICMSFYLFRVGYTGKRFFLFLNWNLLLAAIPWIFSSIAVSVKKLPGQNLILPVLIALWLMFFPNAPYILTDLFHLKNRPYIPGWFDLVLILSYAWTGLMFGLLSLWDIEQQLSTKLPLVIVKLISVLMLFTGSFGIYLGRYLRWNSWDIVTNPYELATEAGSQLSNPDALGMTLGMGIFLNMVYWTFSILRITRSQKNLSKSSEYYWINY